MYLPNQILTCSWEKSERAQIAECLDLSRYGRQEGLLEFARAMLACAHVLNKRLSLPR